MIPLDSSARDGVTSSSRSYPEGPTYFLSFLWTGAYLGRYLVDGTY